MNTSTSAAARFVLAAVLIALGIALGAAGLYVGHMDDAPGAGGLGLLLMIVLVTLGIRTVLRGRGRA